MNGSTTPTRYAGGPTGLSASLIVFLIRTAAALLLAALVVLEPFVQPLLCAIALLAFATAIFFGFLMDDAAFPFWGMLGLSLMCVLLLALYYRVVRFLYCGR